MALTTPIDSNLQITIYRLFPGADPHDIVTGFKATMITKDVPTALWEMYNPASDPNITRNPDSLRQPSQPTLNLCMGVTISIPRIPQHLLQSPLQEFDPTIVFQHSLGTFRIAPAELPNQKFLAGGELAPTAPGLERWKSFAQGWEDAVDENSSILGVATADGTQADGMLKMAAHWLGWDNPPPLADRPVVETLQGKRLPWQLSGELPVSLVGSLNTEYRVLPRESGVEA
jgi:hypothetical protein